MSLAALVGLDAIGAGDHGSRRLQSEHRSLARRRITLGVLALGVAAGAVLLAVAAPLGAAVIAPFVVLLAVDLGLLVAHEQRRSERAMSIAFRSHRAGRTSDGQPPRLGDPLR